MNMTKKKKKTENSSIYETILNIDQVHCWKYCSAFTFEYLSVFRLSSLYCVMCICIQWIIFKSILLLLDFLKSKTWNSNKRYHNKHKFQCIFTVRDFHNVEFIFNHKSSNSYFTLFWHQTNEHLVHLQHSRFLHKIYLYYMFWAYTYTNQTHIF